MGAYYSTAGGHSLIPQIVSGELDAETHSDNRALGFNIAHLLPWHGDGPGYFARPKGIAVDGDGHIWVADEIEDRLQVFNRKASC